MVTIKAMLADAEKRIWPLCHKAAGKDWQFGYSLNQQAAAYLRAVAAQAPLELPGRTRSTKDIPLMVVPDTTAYPDLIKAMDILIVALGKAGLKARRSMRFGTDANGSKGWTVSVTVTW